MPYKDPIKQKEYFRNRLKKMFTNKCLDCGKNIFKKAKRCKPCSKKKEHRNPLIRQSRWAKKVNGVYLQPLITRIRDLTEYSKWRMAVLRKDNFTCQNCSKRGVVLQAHHIKRFLQILIENQIDSIDKALVCTELWNIHNGKALCFKCHKLEHSKCVSSSN